MVTVVTDRERSVEFDGELLAEQGRRAGDAGGEKLPRWPEFRIWRLAAGGYMAQRLGCSIVYHTAGTSCTTKFGKQRGSPATVEDLPDDADPCEFCNPPWPEDLGDDERVRFEFPRSQIRRFRNAPQVIKFFTTWKDPDTGDLITRVTKPVMALLETAAAADAEFAEAGVPREGMAPITQGDDHGTGNAEDIAGGSQRQAG
jgi:hypothetical protein